MDHTVLPANSTIPAFPSWRSPADAGRARSAQLFVYVCRRDSRVAETLAGTAQ